MRLASMKTQISAAALGLALLGVSACSSSSDEGSSETSGTSSTTATAEESSAASKDAVSSLALAESPVGEMIADGDGKTVYVFDKDSKGATTSACTADCTKVWPAVHGTPEDVELDGVDGELGSITGADGQSQLTLDGWPLYYFAKDTKAGDVKGQGVKDVWWVLGADGKKISEKVSK